MSQNLKKDTPDDEKCLADYQPTKVCFSVETLMSRKPHINFKRIKVMDFNRPMSAYKFVCH